VFHTQLPDNNGIHILAGHFCEDAGQRQHQCCHQVCGSRYVVDFAKQDVAEYNPGWSAPFPSHSKTARRWEAVAVTADELAAGLVAASF
jgi:hypothetical protein